jgi:fructokinase
MRDKKPDKRKPAKPRVWGIGLLALDLIIEPDAAQPRVAAGGTCGNVMAILSRLGWNAMPISRLADDPASSLIVGDLQRWGVDVGRTRLRPSARSPIVVQRIRKDAAGIPFHTFSFSCPGCGRRLPGFQPVTTTSVESVVSQNEKPDVLFIDRVSRSSILLAEAASDRGAIVFFEPCGVSNVKQFAEMMEIAHIVKHSHDRLLDVGELEWRSQMLLEVETLGRGGLRFRTSIDSNTKRWRGLQALPVSHLRDTAGCGDWLSSGLIHNICRGGLKQLTRCSFDRLLGALNFGQGLAAWNCTFIGPRGGMYGLSSEQFSSVVRQLQLGKSIASTTDSSISDEVLTYASMICDVCTQGHERGVKPMERVETASTGVN